jgi:plasmid maintenance system antidote protein VapI
VENNGNFPILIFVECKPIKHSLLQILSKIIGISTAFALKSVKNVEKHHSSVIFIANKEYYQIIFMSLRRFIYRCETMERKLNRIKTALVDQGKTNKWLAEQLGKDPATISKWCTNVSQPSLEMMMRIAKLLNVEMNDLVRLEAKPDLVVKSDKTNKK